MMVMQDDIDNAIKRFGRWVGDQAWIAYMILSDAPKEDRIMVYRKIAVFSGWSVTYRDGTEGFVDCKENGIHFKSSYRFETVKLVTWSEADDVISFLARLGMIPEKEEDKALLSKLLEEGGDYKRRYGVDDE